MVKQSAFRSESTARYVISTYEVKFDKKKKRTKSRKTIVKKLHDEVPTLQEMRFEQITGTLL